jgi:hypothetical protein
MYTNYNPLQAGAMAQQIHGEQLRHLERSKAQAFTPVIDASLIMELVSSTPL